MRDPLSISFPLGRVFGITVRIHVLFPLVVFGLILRVAFHKDPVPPPGTVTDAWILAGILLISVLAHEFGHCAGARLVNGDAHEVVIWPLGGLAAIDVPHQPRAHFLAAGAGPAVNVVICLLAALGLGWLSGWSASPPLNPLWYPYRDTQYLSELTRWDGQPYPVSTWGMTLLARSFWLNWVLLLLNLLPAFPLDGGRMAQALAWPRLGFRSSMLLAIYMGFITVLVVAIVAIAWNEVLTLCLAFFIFASNRQQLILLETGGEESVFGYDFSQGYTSLEGGHAPPRRRRRPGFWQRWLQARATRRMQRDLERRESEDRRMDELLEKVNRVGTQGLTEEERRFLKRVSDRYRNRQ
jgi:Zn-dependent protease